MLHPNFLLQRVHLLHLASERNLRLCQILCLLHDGLGRIKDNVVPGDLDFGEAIDLEDGGVSDYGAELAQELLELLDEAAALVLIRTDGVVSFLRELPVAEEDPLDQFDVVVVEGVPAARQLSRCLEVLGLGKVGVDPNLLNFHIN